jgi:proteasome accessory factor B
MKRTVRIKQIEQLLLKYPNGLRVLELSQRCGVDRRTIYRDLEVMTQLGIPIWQANGRYGIAREQQFASLTLTVDEVFQLLWAIRLLEHQHEAELSALNSLLQKLLETLPPELSRQIEAVSAVLPHHPSDPQQTANLQALARAWADNLKLQIDYHSQSQHKTIRRVIAPYLFDSTPQGKLYIIGMDEQTRDIRIFSFKRIVRATVLEDEPFRRSLSFDLAYYLNAANELTERDHHDTVVLKFLPKAASIVKDKPLSPTAHLESYDDGSMIYIAEVKDWPEMEKWVQSWGAQVEVIAPVSFRKAIASEHRQAVKLYG